MENLNVPAIADAAKNFKPVVLPAVSMVDSSLMFGLSTEQQNHIKSVVDMATKRHIPNCGGEVAVLVLFEHTYIVRKTESERPQGEYVKNIQLVELPKVDENKNTIDENMIPTGRKDANGKEIMKVKVQEVVKGWKQVSYLVAKQEQTTTVYFPYVLRVKDANNWSDILGHALTLHLKEVTNRETERKGSIKKSGYYHCYMNIGKESVGTKLVSKNGIEARLLFSDFKSFAKGTYNRLKTAIEMKQDKAQEKNSAAIFED